MSTDVIAIGSKYYRLSAISSFRGDPAGYIDEVNGEPIIYPTKPHEPGSFARQPNGYQRPLSEMIEPERLNLVTIDELLSAIDVQAAALPEPSGEV